MIKPFALSLSLLLLGSCGGSSDPPAAACTPVTVPAAKPEGEADSVYLFRVAQACVDNAAHSIGTSQVSLVDFQAQQAIASCAAEIRASVIANTEIEREALRPNSIYGLDVPLTEDEWFGYAQARIRMWGWAGRC